MPVFLYICKNCEKEVRIFSHKEQVCPKCGSDTLKKIQHIPVQNRNTVGSVTDYRGTEYTLGIEEDVKKRSRKNTNDNLKETIDKFGEKISREQGWIKEDGKIRTDWDD